MARESDQVLALDRQFVLLKLLLAWQFLEEPSTTFFSSIRIRCRFGWADPTADVARAAGVVVDFVLAYAPLLVIGPELAEQIGNFLFILALDTLVESKPVQETNRIPSSLVSATKTSIASTTTSVSSTSGCPNPTNTPVSK